MKKPVIWGVGAAGIFLKRLQRKLSAIGTGATFAFTLPQKVRTESREHG